MTPEMIARWARALVFSLVPMLLSLAVHEYAHARVARALGDDTAEREGRLTLNPLAHADPWGTFIVPAVAALTGGIALLGWARPVRVRADMLKARMPKKLALALVALAGPLSNALLAVVSTGAMALLLHFHVALTRVVDTGDVVSEKPTPLGLLLQAMIVINVGLTLVNFVPIPPLDGARLLPRAFGSIVRPLERYALAIVVIAFFLVPSIGQAVLATPVMVVTDLLMRAFGVA